MTGPSPAASLQPPGNADALSRETRPGGRRTAAIVLGLCFLGSTLIAVITYGRFARSEELILNDLKDAKNRGALLPVEGCVDDVLAWHKNCSAMQTLCDRTIGRMMEQCLAGRDRSDYCRHVDMDKAQTSGFGFQECVAIAGKNRTLKKHCGTTYKAIAYYCAEVQKQLGMENVPVIGSVSSGATGMEASP